MKGRTMLKVTSILMIIFSILALVGAGFLFVAIGALMVGFGGGAVAVVITIIAAVFTLIGAILELITGIFGNKCVKNPSAAALRKCFIMDVVVIILCVISLILSGVSGDVGVGSMVFSAICSLVIPVLYMLGVQNMKKSLLD